MILITSSLLLALLVLAGWNEISPKSVQNSLLQDIMQAHPGSDELADSESLFQAKFTHSFSIAVQSVQ
jgi:hypothetical protein